MERFSDAAVAILLALMSGLFGGLVWLMKLDAKVNASAEDIERHDREIAELKTLSAKISEDLSAIRESTAGIKGYLSMPDRHNNKT